MRRKYSVGGSVALLALSTTLGAWESLAGQPSDTVVSEAATFTVEVMLQDVEVPNALTFLHDGRAILAQRSRATFGLADFETGAVEPIAGLPNMFTGSGGGALDVVPHPDHARNGWIYVSYALDGPGGPRTVLDRARLDGTRWVDRERLFEVRPGLDSEDHFGGRIVLAGGFVFLASGDRNTLPLAQSLATHTGAVIRLRDDGSVPVDNPLRHLPDALPEIWTYGHRNPQGLALDGAGRLWLHEHGPQGGDELNLIEPGRNYGWPTITYGEDYEGGPIGEGLTRRPGLEQPVYYYRPSIAPSDLVIHSGRGFEGWRGNALIGAMGLEHLNRLVLDGERVIHEERLLEGRGWRVRMVEEGPDGSVYLGVDAGLVLRLRPVG